jgi:hypothetical protein
MPQEIFPNMMQHILQRSVQSNKTYLDISYAPEIKKHNTESKDKIITMM